MKERLILIEVKVFVQFMVPGNLTIFMNIHDSESKVAFSVTNECQRSLDSGVVPAVWCWVRHVDSGRRRSNNFSI